ncbi:hypothetical protein ACEN8I_05280 [Polaromonas sp. CT11-55]|uniref:hypothetical protein n=1 Tax=Polaromonas sp. CT11-55 TaxID=3243045 RepID=UPI0039A4AC61
MSQLLPRPKPNSSIRTTEGAAPSPATPAAQLPSYVGIARPPIFQRNRLERLRPHYSDPTLNKFARQVFSDDSAVSAYFFPRLASDVQNYAVIAPQAKTAAWVPLEVALAAAGAAQSAALVQPHERELVHLAAFVYPCGLFHCARVAVIEGYKRMPLDGDWVRILRGLFLEDALRTLRTWHASKADTLSAVLGLDGEGDVNEEQVARLASVVHLAHLKTNAIWAPPQATDSSAKECP